MPVSGQHRDCRPHIYIQHRKSSEFDDTPPIHEKLCSHRLKIEVTGNPTLQASLLAKCDAHLSSARISPLGAPQKAACVSFSARRSVADRIEKNVYCSTMLQPESGSNTLIAVAASVVVFPRSFCSSTPSWLIMKVITPELPYSAG